MSKLKSVYTGGREALGTDLSGLRVRVQTLTQSPGEVCLPLQVPLIPPKVIFPDQLSWGFITDLGGCPRGRPEAPERALHSPCHHEEREPRLGVAGSGGDIPGADSSSLT